MLAVFLTCLKVLGIALLSVLALVILLLLLVLFVPIRYRVEARKLREEDNGIFAKIKITWLLHLLNICFQYPDAAYVRVRILFFTIFRSDKPKESTDKMKNIEDEEKKESKSSDTSNVESTEQVTEEKTVEEEKRQTATGQMSQPEEDEEQSKQNINEKIEIFLKAVLRFLKKLKYTIKGIYDKIKEIIHNIRYYCEIIKSDLFQRTWNKCSKEIFALLKSIAPRKIKGQIEVGMEDPATTGQILAYYGMLYPVLGDKINVIPNFEQVVLQGDLLIKGKITIYKVLKTAFVVYFNNDMRKLLKLLKKEDA